MERSENIGELVTALAKAQGEFSAAVKDSDNPYYNSKYADLSAVINAVRPALSKHGIALIQTSEADLERQTASVTTSLHLGEEWISNTAEAPATGKGKKAPDDPSAPTRFDVQTIGAAWTYLRRYTLQGLVGVPAEDDDGNSVVGNNAPIKAKQPAEKWQAQTDQQSQGPITDADQARRQHPYSDGEGDQVRQDQAGQRVPRYCLGRLDSDPRSRAPLRYGLGMAPVDVGRPCRDAR